MLFDTDFSLIANNDVLYLAPRGKLNNYFLFFLGEDFNYCAILDDYELGRTLGVGGYGKVILGKHRENKSEVAIKFTDIGD
jgi:serine/threonine protein kinase